MRPEHRPFSSQSAARTAEMIAVQGIPVDNLELQQASQRIVRWCQDAGPRQVCFVNAHCLNEARHDEQYRGVLRDADLVLADGSGIKLAGQLLGRPVRDNVNGTDLFPPLLQRLARRRVYLLGARRGVAQAVSSWIRRHHPSVDVCGVQHGYFDRDEEAGIIRGVAAMRPDVLFVAMGVPRQDRWIAEHLEQLGASVAIGVGGLFDFYSGRIPRAPRWMRARGLEWMYRLRMEPGRMWRRYLVGNTTFVAHTVREQLLGPPPGQREERS